MTEIIMPKAGMAMETGKIVRWLVSEGDLVNAGDIILEIETDKVSMEVESYTSGTVLKLYAKEGDVIRVTEVIGYLGEPGEIAPEAPASVRALKQELQQKKDNVNNPDATNLGSLIITNGNKTPATPLAKKIAKQQNINIEDVTPSGRLGYIKAADVLGATALIGEKMAATPLAKTLAKQRGINLANIAAGGHNGYIKAIDVPIKTFSIVKATPLARAIAEKNNIDLNGLAGAGRIYAKDVSEAMQSAVSPAKTAISLMDDDTRIPLNGMRNVIARRMLESHIEVPPVTLHTKADVTDLLEHRKKMNAVNEEKISINDYIIEACAMSLKEMPEANISFGGDCIIKRGHVNIGVAVALDEGLIVPVIKDADKKDIKALSGEMKSLAKKARTGVLGPDEYTGGTFTISNLGMMGITYFTPIINLPESMILGVNAIEKVLSLDDNGRLYNRNMMGLSLTFDHRAHDGASAAAFLQKVVKTMERFSEPEVKND